VLLRAFFVAALLGGAGCTVAAGTTPDASACTAKPDFFVSDVWPRYFEANQCGSRTCHDFTDGHGYLRLRVPEPTPPAAGTPIAEWPLAWRENYLSAIQLLRCDDPLASRLLTVPEGEANLHPPGPIVRDRAGAALLMQTWVAP
jgi:hypothetical protein